MAHNLTSKLHCQVCSSANLINIIRVIVTILQWTSDYADDIHLFMLHSKDWYDAEGFDENDYFDYLAIMKQMRDKFKSINSSNHKNLLAGQEENDWVESELLEDVVEGFLRYPEIKKSSKKELAMSETGFLRIIEEGDQSDIEDPCLLGIQVNLFDREISFYCDAWRGEIAKTEVALLCVELLDKGVFSLEIDGEFQRHKLGYDIELSQVKYDGQIFSLTKRGAPRSNSFSIFPYGIHPTGMSLVHCRSKN